MTILEIRTCFNYHIFKCYGTLIFMNIELDIFESTYSKNGPNRKYQDSTFLHKPKYVLQ